MQASPLGGEPLLEHLLAGIEPLQERPPVERVGIGKRALVVPGGQRLEAEGVDRQVLSVHTYGVAGGVQVLAGVVAERGSDLVEGLAQTLARLLVEAVAPQQSRQVLAVEGAPRLQRQIGEERPCLLVGEAQRPVGPAGPLATAEEGEFENAHTSPASLIPSNNPLTYKPPLRDRKARSQADLTGVPAF